MSGLTVGPRPPRPAPRRVQLGADAWALLVSALPDAPLPPPFRAQDGPPLDDALRAAAGRALRDAELLTGDSGDLLADLHPSVRASLRAHAAPIVTVDAAVGLGSDQRISHHAVCGHLASGLVRSQRPTADAQLELGPVELTAMLVDDVAAEVLRGFGSLDGAPDRTPLQLDAAASVAVVRALQEDRDDLVRSVLERPVVPPVLKELADGLEAVARVDVTSAAGQAVLVAVRLADGWWTVALSGDDVTLHPVGEDELVTELASALAGGFAAALRTAGDAP